MSKCPAANCIAASLAAAESADEARRTAEIIAFPLDRATLRALLPGNRLGMRERIETLTWAAMVASPSGYTRVSICNGGPDPEIGDFVLIYEDGREWATFGVSCDDSIFSVWRASGPAATLGGFATIREALDAVMAQPKRRRRSPTIPVR